MAAPVEGPPVRVEAGSPAAEEFSALISMLIPGAAPQSLPEAAEFAAASESAGRTAEKPETAEDGESQNGASQIRREERKTKEQPAALPFPIQTFIPLAELQAKLDGCGGELMAQSEAVPASTKISTEAPPAQADAQDLPAQQMGPAEFEAAIPEDAPVTEAPPAPAAARAAEEEKTPEPLRQAIKPAQAAVEAETPALAPGHRAEAPSPAPAPAPAAAPAPAPAPTPGAEVPAARDAAVPRPTQPANTFETPANKHSGRTAVQTQPGNGEAASGQTLPASETEVAFAARLSERTQATAAQSPAPVDSDQQAPVPARPVPADPVQPAPAKPSEAQGEAPDPQPEKKVSAAPRQAAFSAQIEQAAFSAHVEPAAPQATPASGSAAPALEQAVPASAPAAPAALKPATPPARAVPLMPAARADFEPVRTDTAPQPLRELSMLVPGQGAGDREPERVEVRVVERAGQVHVAVRSADARLNQSLAENLGELVANLENRGYATETWRPQGSGAQAGLTAALSDAQTQPLQPGAGNENAQESGRGRQDAAGEESPQQQQRRGQDEARPEWLEMLEGAFRGRNDNPIRSTFA